MLSANPKFEVIALLYQQLRRQHLIEERLVDSLVQLNSTGDEFMDDITKGLLERLDAATTSIATKLQTLVDAANAAGSASAAEIDAALTPEIEKLESLGKP